MKRITFNLPAGGTVYIPAPVRGIVSGAKAVWQATVTTNNIITISRDTTAVCLITAVTLAGMVRETGVPDVTNKDLVFDPALGTIYGVIKVVASGGNSVASVVTLEFDEFASIKQAALEA